MEIHENAQATDSTNLDRREAMKQGLAMVAAGGLAFNAPKVQGLAVQPKHGSALSEIKKRRRCRTGPVQFRCQPRRRTSTSGSGNYKTRDAWGRCTYKSGVRGHRDDFNRSDIEKYTGVGTVSGDSLAFEYIVAENTGNECPVVFNFHHPQLRFAKLNYVGANNCRIPSEVFNQTIGTSGACEAPVMWSTPSWAAGTNTLSMSCSFEEGDAGSFVSFTGK